MSQTLAALFAEQNILAEALIAGDGELTPELEAALSNIEVALPAKIDGYFLILERLEAEAAYFKTRAAEFGMASRSLSTAKERLKENLKFHMEQNGLKEILGNDFKFSLSASKPKVVLQEDLIPKEYKREVIEIHIDKDRIAEDLKLGVPVPGAKLEEVFAFRPSINKKVGQKKKPELTEGAGT